MTLGEMMTVMSEFQTILPSQELRNEAALQIDRDDWKAIALRLATSDGNDRVRLAIRAAGLTHAHAREEFAHAWKFCTADERRLVRLVCEELGVQVPE